MSATGTLGGYPTSETGAPSSLVGISESDSTNDDAEPAEDERLELQEPFDPPSAFETVPGPAEFIFPTKLCASP